MMDSFVLAVIAIVTCVFLWLKYRYQYWERHRVPYMKPESFFLGNIYEVVTGKTTIAENVLKNYKALAPHRFGGVFNLYQPLLYIRDPELVKNVLIKDFNHFYDRNFHFANKKDPLSLHLFNQVGEEWKILRNKLTPTFTSGKMKILFELMKVCVERMEGILDNAASNGEVIQVKELMARYTTDVISSCAFGLETNTLNEPNSEFREKMKEVLAPSMAKRVRGILFRISPKLLNLLHWKSMPNHLNDFFIDLVRDTIEYRTQNEVVRNDFLNLLMNIQNEEKVNKTKNFDFDMGILTAQCFVFLLAGFETSSSLLSFMLYELAEHPDVQKKIQDEVDHVLDKHDKQITYDSLQDMRYMDQVVNETSRLFPALPFLMRTCTKNYLIPGSDYTIKTGQVLFIPVFGLHRDPQYYSNPDDFNPEHFSEEAKAARPSCCFLPFGDGPRICIGSRFGLMQVKLALTKIMKDYTVTVAPEMKRPIQLMKYALLSTTRDDILLHFTKRNALAEMKDQPI